MSETFSKVEVITGVARRRFTTEQKLLVVNERLQTGLSISYVAGRHGLSPSLVFRWRRLMTEGGKEAVRADEEVVAASAVRRLEERIRDFELMLGRKTMEVEILKEAFDLARVKKPTLLSRSQAPEDTPSRVSLRPSVWPAPTWLSERAVNVQNAGPQTRAGVAELTSDIRRLVDGRPRYGYRRIAALLKRERRSAGHDPVNAKRVTG